MCVVIGMTLTAFTDMRMTSIVLLFIGLTLLLVGVWITDRKHQVSDTIYFTKLSEDTIVPSKSKSNAGYDIYANFSEPYMLIHPHETLMIPTKLASVFSEKYYMQLFERGSTGTKGIGQRCGVIDASFRGEWFLPITNHNTYPIVIAKKGVTEEDIYGSIAPKHVIYPYEKALCQAVVLPVPNVEIKELNLEEYKIFKSERGAKCLGSSGK